MIHKSPEANLLFYKFLPLEVMAHLAALVLLASHYETQLGNSSFTLFLYGLAGISITRVVILFVLRYMDSSSEESLSINGAFVLYLSNLLAGLSWGVGIAWIVHSIPGISFNESILPFVIAGLLVASLAGSALHAFFFAAFAVPCLTTLVVYSSYYESLKTTSDWMFLGFAALLTMLVSLRFENILARYRSISRQNTTLLQDLAVAKEQAEHNRQTIEKAHEVLIAEVKERKAAEKKIRASEKETARILHDMQDTYFQVNKHGQIIRISPSVQFLVGYSETAILGQDFSKLFTSTSRYEQFEDTLAAKGGMLQSYETRFQHAMGYQIWVSINANYSSKYMDSEAGFEGTIRDYTETKIAAEALFQEKERLHVTLESIGDGVITTDMDRNVQYINPVAEWMTGWNEENARDKPITTVFKLVDEDSNRPVALPLKSWLEEGKRSELVNPVVLLNKKQERTYSIEVTGSPICDSKGNVTGAVLVFRNVSKLHTLTKQLSYQASHDALTGLINRKEFESRVKHAIDNAQKDDKSHALCYVDLDQFKIVNDTCGHHAGDELLIQLTASLQNALRESDTLARLGGDEFGILLIGCPLDRAKSVAETVRSDVEKFRFIWEDRVFRVGASIGLVSITPDTQDLTELLSAADSACYVAKEGGRNQVHIYKPNDQAISERQGQMQWTHRIQSALEENRFELHFQSIVSLQEARDSSLNGEILVRMIETSKNAENKLIMPNAFIPAAERYQLMPKIDQWVVTSSLNLLSEQDHSIKNWGMCSINLSGQSIGNEKLLEVIIDTLNATGVPPSIICFEITESSVISNLDNAHQFINTLKEMGCRFALDDFGTGLSSFAYLKNLPVDYLKLDGELVKDIAVDNASFTMVEAMNRVAHVMGMETIAEHVESTGTLSALEKIGINYAQGFVVEPPVPLKWASRPLIKAS